MLPQATTASTEDEDQDPPASAGAPWWWRAGGLGAALTMPIAGESLAYTHTAPFTLAALPLTTAALHAWKHASGARTRLLKTMHTHNYPKWARTGTGHILPTSPDPLLLRRTGRIVNGALITACIDGASSGIWGTPAMLTWLLWGGYTSAAWWRMTAPKDKTSAPAEDVEVDALAAMWDEMVGGPDGAIPRSHLAQPVQVPQDKGGGWEGIAVLPRKGGSGIPQDLDSLMRALDLEDGQLDLERINARRFKVRKLDRDPLAGIGHFMDHMRPMDRDGFVTVGLYRDGTEARIKLVDPGKSALHMFIVGGSGSGKGGLVDELLCLDRMSGIASWYIDGGNGKSAPHWIGKIDRYTVTEAEHMQALRVLELIALERMAACTTIEWTDSKGRTRSTAKTLVGKEGFPLISVTVDEINTVVKYDGALPILEFLATQGRSLGISLRLVGQSPYNENAGSSIIRDSVKANGSTVVLRLEDAGMIRSALGSAFERFAPVVFPKSFPGGGGRTFGLGVIDAENSSSQKFRTFYLPDEPVEGDQSIPDIIDVQEALEKTYPVMPTAGPLALPQQATAQHPEAKPEPKPVAAKPVAKSTSTTKKAVLAWLAEAPEGQSFLTTQIRKDTDLTSEQIRPCLMRLKDDGVIIGVDRGKWRKPITEKKLSAA